MSKNDFVPMLYTSDAHVAALNKVSGFDPLKLLRRTKSAKTGEEVLKLDLASKKLWFRLAYPKGRVRITPLRITEKLAIYEAQVFLNQNDTEPVSSFTSSIQKAEAPNGQYIQAAQNEAVDNALTDAGFGIQFSDVATPKSERHFGSEYPVSALEGKTLSVNTPPPAEVKKPTVVQQTPPAAQKQPDPIVEKPVVTAPVQTEPVKQTVLPKEEPAPNKAAEQSGYPANQALEILRGGAASQSAATAEVEESPAASTVPVATYTADMPVEEIVKRMTLEQAKAVVVDAGMCRGKTVGELAATRRANLKFFMSAGYTGPNNTLRAASRIVLDSMDKAS